MKSSRWVLGLAIALGLALSAPLLASAGVMADGGSGAQADPSGPPVGSTLTSSSPSPRVDGWFTGSVSVTVSADSSVTVVKNGTTTLTVDATKTFEFVVPGSENGTTSIRHYSFTDGPTTAVTETIRIDSAKPETTITVTAVTPGNSGWARSKPVTVALVATDAHSGIANSWYRASGFDQLYSAPFSVSTEGTWAVQVWSHDKAGNQETTRTLEVRIDTTKPTVSSNATNTSGVPTTVTITASDTVGGSGVGQISYKLDANATQTASVGSITTQVPVTVAGPHTLTYWTTDIAGNVSNSVVSTFSAGDGVAPTTAILGVPAGWTNLDVLFSLTASDTGGSGVKNSFYGIPGAATTTYTAAVPWTTEGTTTINYRSVDTSGNMEATKTATVLLDKSDPIGPASLSYSSLTDTTVKLAWPAATDAVSGVLYYEIRDGASIIATTAATAVTKTGLMPGSAHTFSVSAVDRAGNDSVPAYLALSMPSAAGSQAITAGASKVATLTLAQAGTTETVVVSFQNVTGAGTVTAVRASVPPSAAPTGLKFLGVYWDVSFTGSFTGTASVTLPYDAGIPAGRANAFTIQHWVNGAWVNVPVTVDTVNHTVTAYLTSLSPLVFTEPAGTDLLATITPRYERYYPAYGTSSSVTASLKDASLAALNGYTLLIDRREPSGWVTVATMTPAGDGLYRGYVKPYNYRKTSVRIQLIPKNGYGAVAKTVTLIPEVKLSTPKPSVSRVSRFRTFSVSGSMLPKHSGKGKLIVAKWNGRSYVPVAKYTKTITFSSKGAFKTSLKLPKGTYRFYSGYGADKSTSDHGASKSARSSKVTVR